MKDWQENRIIGCLCAFEQSTKEIDYDKVYVYADGNGGRKQVTLSIGFTEDGGSLGIILKSYVALGGRYAADIAPYLDKVGKGILGTDSDFKALLIRTAQNDDYFNDIQRLAFRMMYLQKGYNIANDLELTLPLSILVIVDSKLHGSLDRVRGLFAEVPPSAGGDEKAFIVAYVNARRNWWRNHPNNPNKTTYRMDCFIDAIQNDNWDLSKPLKANGVTV